MSTLADFSPATIVALDAVVEAEQAHGGDPRFGQDALLSTLMRPLVDEGGKWADVEALLALHEPALEGFLDPYTARTAWAVAGGEFPLFDEEVAA